MFGTLQPTLVPRYFRLPDPIPSRELSAPGCVSPLSDATNLSDALGECVGGMESTAKMTKRTLLLAATAALLCVAPWFASRATRAIRVGTAVVSHTLCSGAFVSGLDPDQLYAEALKPNPGQKLLAKRLRYEVDRKNRQVLVTWAGMFQSRAVYREGFGCTLTEDSSPENVAASASANSEMKNFTPPLSPLAIDPPSPKLEAALDRAFAEPSKPPFRRVKAIVILHNGKIVAERYAPGYTAAIPMLGYSVAKSVTNALIGILVRQGKVSVEQRAPVLTWSDPHDPRNPITINQLLRMTSGLALEESDSGFDPVSRMLFLEPDMAGFAERARLQAPPGTKWEYTSGNALILSRIIRDAVGGHAQDVVDFAQRELFGPLGITTATMEFDATGTPVGSTYTFAPARDWARFGELYRNDGVVNGKRILPEGWVNYSAAPTLDSYYAAGFWTNRGAHGEAKDRIEAGMPEDAFYASGNLGQRIVIIPSQGLVIVRLGLTLSPNFDIRGLLQLIADTTSALKSP
jgi:CubicO group peptidase (beta-lactamase class C family)